MEPVWSSFPRGAVGDVPLWAGGASRTSAERRNMHGRSPDHRLPGRGLGGRVRRHRPIPGDAGNREAPENLEADDTFTVRFLILVATGSEGCAGRFARTDRPRDRPGTPGR